MAFQPGLGDCVGEADRVRECDGERLKVAVAVFEAEAPTESVLVPLPLRLRDGVPVLDGEGTLHDATTASFLYVPTHGSSNSPLVAVKAQ